MDTNQVSEIHVGDTFWRKSDLNEGEYAGRLKVLDIFAHFCPFDGTYEGRMLIEYLYLETEDRQETTVSISAVKAWRDLLVPMGPGEWDAVEAMDQAANDPDNPMYEVYQAEGAPMDDYIEDFDPSGNLELTVAALVNLAKGRAEELRDVSRMGAPSECGKIVEDAYLFEVRKLVNEMYSGVPRAFYLEYTSRVSETWAYANGLLFDLDLDALGREILVIG